MSSFVGKLARDAPRRAGRLTVVVVGVTHEDAAPLDGLLRLRRDRRRRRPRLRPRLGDPLGRLGGRADRLARNVRAIAHFIETLPHASALRSAPPCMGSTGRDRRRSEHRPAVATQYSEVLALAQRVGAHPRRDPASQELTFATPPPTERGTASGSWTRTPSTRCSRSPGKRVSAWGSGGSARRTSGCGPRASSASALAAVHLVAILLRPSTREARRKRASPASEGSEGAT